MSAQTQPHPTEPATAPELAQTCHHCHQPIEWDGEDSYRHLSGFYNCLEAGQWNQAEPETYL